ncbi:MAG TPA: hypothetical protein VKV21_03325 [Solirubrobacteraceae bacterium]|nr:hypothetical protein [Solirubrobacteraceae bacterium]
MTHRLRHLSRIATAGALLVILAGLGASAAVAQRPAASEELAVRALPRVGLPYAGLVGVSCPSVSFCMAVGSFGSGHSTGSFFERWNGRSWRRIAVQRRVSWLAVSCLSASFCLTVGTADRGARVIGARWGGRSWSGVGAFSPPAVAPEPGANPGEGLQVLSCATRRDCWAVGYDYGRTLVEHWNGRSWSRSSAPTRNGNLISVSCSSARDCWAAATPLNATPIAPLHFDGRSWRIVGLPGPFSNRRYQDQVVSCRTLAACWIVGSSSATGGQPAALHRTANHWQMASMPAPQEASVVLQGLDCGSGSDCWALGSASAGAPLPKTSPLAEEWDGSAWHVAKVIGPARSAELMSISCPSASFCMAVGEVRSRAGGPAFAVTRPVH